MSRRLYVIFKPEHDLSEEEAVERINDRFPNAASITDDFISIAGKWAGFLTLLDYYIYSYASFCFWSYWDAVLENMDFRSYHIEEIEAAKAMADHGIIVIMEKEGDPMRATAKDAKGNFKFSEGKLSIEKLSYEQSTRDSLKIPAQKSVKKALEHARDKASQMAVIYDRGGVFHRADIQAGIRYYESFKNNTHRFKAILVIDRNRNVYEWNHTKK